MTPDAQSNDLCNEYDHVTPEMSAEGERPAQIDQSLHSDEGEDEWSVTGGIQNETKEITFVQSLDHVSNGEDGGDAGGGHENIISDSSVVVGAENDWSVNGSIMSSDTPHPPLSHHTNHDHEQSNTITTPQSTDQPTPTSSTHTTDLPTPTSSAPLVPSLQSRAWRQWGKSIDWGRVRGQGSDIYSKAQGNPPISTTPSRGSATPRKIITTPSRVTTTPSKVISVVRPSAIVQGSSSSIDQSVNTLIQSNSTPSGSHTYNTTAIIDSVPSTSSSPPPSSHISAGHVPLNSTIVQSTRHHSIPSPPALPVALLPVRQSPLLSAAASSTFSTPTLAHLATQTLHNKHKVPYYSSYPRSHSNNNNQHNNKNDTTKQPQQFKPSLSEFPPQPPPPPQHHQPPPHPVLLHVTKLPQELEEERLWISSVFKRARDQVTRPPCVTILLCSSILLTYFHFSHILLLLFFRLIIRSCGDGARVRAMVNRQGLVPFQLM